MKLEEIKTELIKLPESDRAELAHLLISSLDTHQDADSIESAWGEESESRLNELLEGKVTGIDARQSLREVRKKLQAKR